MWLIGTQMGAVHLLPGTTFSNTVAKGAYPSEQRAVMTLKELERWMLRTRSRTAVLRVYPVCS